MSDFRKWVAGDLEYWFRDEWDKIEQVVDEQLSRVTATEYLELVAVSRITRNFPIGPLALWYRYSKKAQALKAQGYIGEVEVECADVMSQREIMKLELVSDSKVKKAE
jgi:hypothetical protein